MRTLLTFTCLGLSAMGLAQDFSKPVEYTARAVPLRRALADLSAKSKITLYCSQELNEEPVVLRLHKVPLSQVMKKLAEVRGGEWVRVDKAYCLQLGAQDAKWKEEWIQRRLVPLQKAAAELIQQAKLDKPFDDARVAEYSKGMTAPMMDPKAQFDFNDDRSPEFRLFAQVLQHLDLRPVASIRHLTRRLIYYSDHPTAFEIPLGDMSQALAEYHNTRERITAEVRRIGDTQTGELRDMIRAMVPDTWPQYEKVLVTANALPDQCILTLEFFDANGHRQGGTGQSLKLNNEEEDKSRTKFYKDRAKKELLLDSLTQEMMDYVLVPPPGKQSKPLSERARQALLSPTQFDPLSFLATDVVFSLAEGPESNVAVFLTDWFEGWPQRYERGHGPLHFWLFIRHLQQIMEMQESDGWLTGRPADLEDEPRIRLPRAPMEEFVRAVADQGYVDLEDYARLRLDGGPDAGSWLLNHYLDCLLPGGYPPQLRLDFGHLPALYGTLSDPQRRLARQGVLRIPVVLLSRQQLGLLTEWVFHEQKNVMAVRQYHRDRREVDGLPTELLDRDPLVGQLEVEERPEWELLQLTNTDGLPRTDRLDLYSAAQELLRREQGKGEIEPNARFKMIPRRSVRFRFTIEAGEPFYFEDQITLGWPPVEGWTTLKEALDEAPPEARLLFKKKLDEVRANEELQQQHQGGSTPPPP